MIGVARGLKVIKGCNRGFTQGVFVNYASLYSKLTPARHITYDKGKTDEELQKDSESPWEKWKLVPLLVSEEGVREQDRLYSERIVPGIFWSGVLLTYLYNPLLVKYGFDIYDFMEGARNAIPKLIKTIYSREMAMMRAGRLSASQETLHFLQETLSPCHYLYATKYPPESLKHIVVTDVQLSKLYVDLVDTGIINEGWAQRIKMLRSLGKLQLHSANTQYAMVRMNVEEQQVDNTLNMDFDLDSASNDLYPVGSVLAVVQLNSVYQQSFYTIPHDAEEFPNGRELIETKEISKRWIFEAVISGQAEMKWIVRSYSISKETGSLLP